jgi:hypothetical protein
VDKDGSADEWNDDWGIMFIEVSVSLEGDGKLC